jgi:hypothetical protein
MTLTAEEFEFVSVFQLLPVPAQKQVCLMLEALKVATHVQAEELHRLMGTEPPNLAAVAQLATEILSRRSSP